MNKSPHAHRSDRDLEQALSAHFVQDRASLVTALTLLAEFDARKLYLPAAHPSMHSYCIHELGLLEQAAYKRIHAARTARRFPAILPALAAGRLHLSTVTLLAPHLTEANADELIGAAAHQSKESLQRFLKERFAPPELVALPSTAELPAVEPQTGSEKAVSQLSPGKVVVRTRVLSPASPRFPLQFTVDQETYEMLGYAQELLGHVLRRGDLAQVFKRSLRTLITHLEKRKFAATDKPRTPRRRTSANKRHVPAEVKRAVWARDGGQCTFVSDAGRRCPSRTRLEFDHIDPVARGGEATVDRMRLRCRAHNQYTAECTYGAGFMERKRQEAGRATPQLSPGKATTHIRAAARAQLSPETVGAIGSPENDVVPWLRKLGFRADEARHAAARCEAMPDATLEERVRFALSTLSPGRRCMRAT